jgi:class 3 adenylate cyclase/tetratricopeptide (TPR) repeat protein
MRHMPTQASAGTATVLFTDLVGSTELRTRLGEEAADVLRRTHDRLLSDAVGAHNGTVIKSLGDGVMASFASAADAVAAAVAIQQAIDAHNRHARAQSLVVRVGISVGDVSWEDGDCFGLPVNEAARLCGVAEGGQILVAELVRMLARGRGSQRYTSVGELHLKGLPEPLAACTVAWEPLPDDTVLPLPPLLARAEQFAFAGRQAELDQFAEVWRRVAEGTRSVIFIAGEPGIGKTRLAAETARRVHAGGATVLYGRCDEELGVPFQPFVEAVEYFVAHSPADGLRMRLGRHPGELVRLLPALAAKVDDLPPLLHSDPETESYRLFDAVAAWLAAAAAERPLLLVLDDLHWAAKPTLLLFKHIVRSAELSGPAVPAARPRLLIIGTHRDTEVGRAHPLTDLLADLRRDTGVERMPLRGLDEAGVEAFVTVASGQADATAQQVAHAVWAETEGNPFFIGEVLRHLVESHAVFQRDGRWVTAGDGTAIGIPEGVRDVIGRRLSRLPAAANDVLSVAAVIGRDFDVGVLAAVSGVDEDVVLSVLEAATAARLIDETGVNTYRFAHALVRSTLSDALSASRRVRLHRRIGEAIEARHPHDVTALAYHFAQAAADGDGAKGVEYASRAADEAVERLAHDQAVFFYQQALDLLDALAPTSEPRVAQRCELLIRLGDAQRRAGDPAYRPTLLQAAQLAQDLNDTGRLVHAALANDRGWISAQGAVDVERVAVLEAALASVDPADSAQRARLLARLAAEITFSGDRERLRALADQALQMARRVGEAATLAHVLNTHFPTVQAPDTLTERLANTAEHLLLAEQLGDPLIRFHAALNRAVACLEAGDIAAVDQYLDSGARLADELGQPPLRWQVTFRRSVRALVAGRLDEAERLATEAFQLGDGSGQPDAAAIFAGQLFLVRYDQGRVAELEAIIAQTVADNPGLPVFRAVLALAYCELDRYDEAQRIFAADAANDFAEMSYDSNWLCGMCMYGEVCARLDAAASAAALAERLAPFRHQIAFNGGGILGSVARYLGLLDSLRGRYDAAESAFADAAAAHEHLGAPIWLARTHLDWARMLLRKGRPGDAARARSYLATALAVARARGCAAIERRATGLLQAAAR